MARYLLYLAILVPILAHSARARVLDVGPGRAYAAPSAAAAVAKDGDIVAIHPGTYIDCAVWTANRLIVEGVGDAAKVVIADKSCQEKALFVTVGEGIAIRNLTLSGARVPDANGAGIRGEGRDLTVERVRFLNNQNGIMSGTKGGTMTIRDSLFERNGACIAACAHGIYAGEVDLLRVENSHLLATQHGHHIKSRALRTEIVGCVIEDGPDGTASYEVDIPNGGDLILRGNTIQKGPKAENHRAIVVLGVEGLRHPTREIAIHNNQVRNDGPWDVLFLDNRAATPAVFSGNRLSGRIAD